MLRIIVNFVLASTNEVVLHVDRTSQSMHSDFVRLRELRIEVEKIRIRLGIMGQQLHE